MLQLLATEVRSALSVVAVGVLALLPMTACAARQNTGPNTDEVDRNVVKQVAELEERAESRDGSMQHLLFELDYATTFQTCLELGDAAYNAYDYSTAVALYEEAFDRGRVDADLLTRIGWLWQPTDPERAIYFYELAISIKPDQWDAYFNRANALFQLRRLNDTYQRVMSGPYDYQPESDGNVEVTHGAIYYYNELILEQQKAGVPVTSLAFYNRAHCFYLAGSYAQARKNYISFYENGGASTKFAARALRWIRAMEDELCLPTEYRYQPGPGAQ
ncbi:MAG: hypothetical protein AB7K09_08515 [Planctomycetota bacterium]